MTSYSQLLENHYIQMKELRKSMAASAPGKSIYLFYCELESVVRAQLTNCYRALYNLAAREDHELSTHARYNVKQNFTLPLSIEQP